jgi:hypothetical protein
MKASDAAAWWGAVVATIVLLWDIYKWKTTGPRLVVKAVPGMQELGDRTEKKLISVEVTNRGDRPTTLTHLAFIGYTSLWNRLRRKRSAKVGFVPRPGGTQPFPYQLPSGDRWLGFAEQDAIKAYHKEPYLYAAVYHSGSNKPSLCRVDLADC